MMELAAEEEFVPVLLDKVMQYPLEMGLQFIDAGVDMIWLGDDIATQQNMLMSPHRWHTHFKPLLAAKTSRLYADKRLF